MVNISEENFQNESVIDNQPVNYGDGNSEEDEDDDLHVSTYHYHTIGIASADISKDGLLAITGGLDNKACIWYTTTLQTLLESTDYNKPVVGVGFNFDDQYAATGDQDGVIHVWNLKDNTQMLSLEIATLNWLIWHHTENILIAGSNTGRIKIWDIPENMCKILTFHNAPVFSGKISPDGETLVAGYCSGFFCVWDIKTGNQLWNHQTPSGIDIKFLDVVDNYSSCVFGPSGELVNWADRDMSKTFLSDERIKITALALNNTYELLATIGTSGTICLWDFKNKVLKHTIEVYAPLTALVWSSLELFYVGSILGDIYICDSRRGEVIEILTGYFRPIKFLHSSKDKSTILVVSHRTSSVKLFLVDNI